MVAGGKVSTKSSRTRERPSRAQKRAKTGDHPTHSQDSQEAYSDEEAAAKNPKAVTKPHPKPINGKRKARAECEEGDEDEGTETHENKLELTERSNKRVKGELTERGEELPETLSRNPKRKRKTKDEKEGENMPLAARSVGLRMLVGAHVSSAKGE